MLCDGACVDGQCTCPAGSTKCSYDVSDVCVDLMTDSKHCGTCLNYVSKGRGGAYYSAGARTTCAATASVGRVMAGRRPATTSVSTS